MAIGWTATELPRWRSDMIRDLESGGGNERAERVALWLRAAELYWVTQDMTTVALDASRDLPGWIPAAVMPEPIGLMIWAGQVPALRRSDGEVRGVLWSTFGGQVHLLPLSVADQSRVPSNARQTGAVRVGELVQVSEVEPFPVAKEITADSGGRAAAFVLFLGATWIMMQQPTVTTPRLVRGSADSSRLMKQLPRRVTVIDLRPMRHVTVDHDPEHPGRMYSHRWIVRGHWRNQPVGPGRSEIRRLWVPSYTKGPDGAPLLARERVNVWRR